MYEYECLSVSECMCLCACVRMSVRYVLVPVIHVKCSPAVLEIRSVESSTKWSRLGCPTPYQNLSRLIAKTLLMANTLLIAKTLLATKTLLIADFQKDNEI